MDAVLRDLRYAVRMLLRTPGVTAAAIVALALGIGATTAIFSVVNAVMLRSLGWGEESRLVAVRGNFEAQNLIGISVSVPEYQDLRKAPFLQPVGVYAGYTAALEGVDRAERISVGYATGTFFGALIPGWTTLLGGPVGGYTPTMWLSFLLFWALNIYIIYRGMNLLRKVENWAAPFVLLMTLVLLAWALSRAGGVGHLLTEPGKFHTWSEFAPVFVPASKQNAYLKRNAKSHTTKTGKC